MSDVAPPVGKSNPDIKPDEEDLPKDPLEVNDKDTELLMLEEEAIEDEKMPSYMNVTSISSSTKPDDSKIETDEQTQPQLEAGELSGEKTPENRRPASDGTNSVVELSSEESTDHEYDEDEYSSEYDEEDDEYIRRHEEDDEDESDGELEAEQFERSSDDFMLRPSVAVESQIKERSRSLQDLTSPKSRTAKFNSKRQFPVMSPHMEVEGKVQELYFGGQRKSSFAQIKYGHVHSKVKQYIEGIKDQNRKSAQRRSIEKLDVNRELANLMQRDKNYETDIRVNPQSRLLKSYMEKHIIVEDPARAEDMTINRHLVENGSDIITVDNSENFKKSYEATMVMDVDKENKVREEKMNRQTDNKQNGLVDYSLLNIEVKPDTKEKGRDNMSNAILPNGKDEIHQISQVQTLSYEDFMRGHFEDSNQKTEIQSQKTENIETEYHQQEAPMEQEGISIAPSSLKIQSAESISEEIVITDKEPLESPEVALLKAQLNQKIAECEGFKEDYKAVVNKNFELKRELDELKRTFAKYQQEHQPRETKTAEVQTEELPSVFDKSTVSHLKDNGNKLSASSLTSAQSLSQNWTDSNCSPTVSLKPPSVGSILNSDDSLTVGTPRKTSRPLSQAFYTSSRIIQTLANITQGRTDPASTGVRRNYPGQSKEPLSPLVTSAYGSRKRKASESHGTSAFGPQAFKMPHLSTNDKRRKYNSGYETDAADKSTADPTNSSRDSASHKNDGNIPNEDELSNKEEIKINDGIKCFVYKEDEYSKERSFLLQAEETDKVDSNGVVRECGPFLLANLEIRMSEANGAINIWGKEISHDSTSEDVEEDLEEDTSEGNELWLKTPSDRLGINEFACSTNKKAKAATPQLGVRSRISRQLRTVLNHHAGQLDDSTEKPYGSMPNLDNRGLQACPGCTSSKSIYSPAHTSHARVKQHICCMHNHGVNDCQCGAIQHTCGVNHGIGCRFVSASNPVNLHGKHTCTNFVQSEEICRHHTASHPLSGSTEDGCCHVTKRCHSVDIPCNARIENTYPRGRIPSADEQSLFTGEIAPLLTSEKSSEASENARRRVSGKRVRGFLRDFLKGCGDCRHPQTTSFEASRLQEADANSIPEIRVTPSAQEANQENPSQTSNCDKCCHSMADFQQQFEQFKADVEKIHSKSDALFKMMSTLRNLDAK